MRFEVPQFIEVEDKIFGPLTFKQFVYLAGGGGLCVIIWIFVPKIIGIFLILAVGAFALALAFYQPNNKPFVAFVEAALRYVSSGKLYIWKKEERKAVGSGSSLQKGAGDPAELTVPRLSDSRLRDLAWSLDVHDSLYSDQTQTKQ